jgi:uncharacterized protein VirK/YbjX
VIVSTGPLPESNSQALLAFSLEDAPRVRLPMLAAAMRSYSHGGPNWLRNSAKFFLRTLRHPRLSRAWIDRLHSPGTETLWRLRPRLAQKLQRPYLCFDTPAALKLEYLDFHYRTLPLVLAPEALVALHATGLPLLELRSEGQGRSLGIQLWYRDQYEMEGEMSLVLSDLGTGLPLAILSFTLIQQGGRAGLLVGGLQSSPDPRTRSLIHDVSRELFGMRPKALALWVLQGLARSWGLEFVRAVSDARHVYRKSRKRGMIHCSYDEFWAESDGSLGSDRLWDLPLLPVQRSRAELKPSRRRQHELRYAMLSSLGERLVEALGRLRPGFGTLRLADTSVPRFTYKGPAQGGAAVGNAAVPPSSPALAVTDHSF